MSFKAFFIHFNRGPGKVDHRRGFTAKVSPSPQNEDSVLVQIAECSAKDQFCKKTGRLAAELGEATQVTKKDLPQVLAECETWCRNNTEITFAKRYNYVKKYMS